LKKDSKIYVAGHNGLVGSAIVKNLRSKGYDHIIFRTSAELDLRDPKQVAQFFKTEQPEYVFLAAAKVGGIVANNTYRGEFIYDNLMIQNNIIEASRKHEVKKLLFLGSTCIYPRESPQPMKEEYMLTSPLEYTNEPYAIAKIAGMKLCESYNLQYGTNNISVMPTNLYGPNDNFDLEKSHVLPALIRKIHLGKALMEGDWDAIRADLDKRPVEGVDGGAGEEEIVEVLGKYGISGPQTADRGPRSGFGVSSGAGDSKSIQDASTGSDGAKSQNSQPSAVRGPASEHSNSEAGNSKNAQNTPTGLDGAKSQNPPPSAVRGPRSGEAGKAHVEIWGTGSPMREFLWSEDMADACVYVMESVDFKDIISINGLEGPGQEIRNVHLNIGTGKDISIKALAHLIRETIGFKGELYFNTSKPDGTLRKLTDPSKLHQLGWKHSVELQDGVRKMYEWYLSE
jgi:nucleoside-diphosphate-sugar epimerase